MSTRYFCDVCEAEMKPHEHGRIQRKLNGVSIEVHVAHNDVWNGGHVCWNCVLGAVNNGVKAD